MTNDYLGYLLTFQRRHLSDHPASRSPCDFPQPELSTLYLKPLSLRDLASDSHSPVFYPCNAAILTMLLSCSLCWIDSYSGGPFLFFLLLCSDLDLTIFGLDSSFSLLSLLHLLSESYPYFRSSHILLI